MEEHWKFWKKIGHGGTKFPKGSVFEVSDFGRVRVNGNVIDVENTYAQFGNYLKVSNSWLHRVVGELFVDNPDNKPHIDHIDGNPHNNRADNLRWCTISENLNNPITKQRIDYVGKICHSTPEAREHNRQAQLKYWQSEEGVIKREEINKKLIGRKAWNKGKTMSEEYCLIQSKLHKGLQKGEKNPMYRNYKKHYTNGVEEKRFTEGEQPEGWWRGTLRGKNKRPNT